MKRLLFLTFAMVVAASVIAQPKLDLGIKGGVNFSKISLDVDDYSSESVTKSHIGIFGRVGWERVFIQPELYFSGKGGDVTSDISSTISSFNYKTFDVPILLGAKVIKGNMLDLYVLGGPVFSNITKDDVSGGVIFDESYYTKHYMGIQYGVGIDILFLTIDARMENGLGKFYQNGSSAKNNAFMLSVGIKIL
ncbi:MAG: outer membrane beta-barrel protein [Draconibacterium sp.]|jgi:hypothetical protein